MQAKGGYVYILSNKYRNVSYIGVTSNIRNRVYQYKFEKESQFTHKYNTKDLMYYRFFVILKKSYILKNTQVLEACLEVGAYSKELFGNG